MTTVIDYLSGFHRGITWVTNEGNLSSSEPMESSNAENIAQTIQADISGLLRSRDQDPELSKGICRPKKKDFFGRQKYLTVDKKRLEQLLSQPKDEEKEPLQKKRSQDHLGNLRNLNLNPKFKIPKEHLEMSLQAKRTAFHQSYDTDVLSESLKPSSPGIDTFFKLESGSKRSLVIHPPKFDVSVGVVATPGQEPSYFEKEIKVTKGDRDYILSAFGLVQDSALGHDGEAIRGNMNQNLEENIPKIIHNFGSQEEIIDQIGVLLRSRYFKYSTVPITLVVIFENKVWILNLNGTHALLSQKDKPISFGNPCSLSIYDLEKFSTKISVLTLASKGFWKITKSYKMIQETVVMLAESKKTSEEISQFLVDTYNPKKENKFAIVTLQFSKN